MAESPPGTPPAKPTRESLGDIAGSTAGSMLSYLQARLLLLRIETKEAGRALTRKYVFLTSATSLFFLAYALLIAAAVSLGSDRFELRWEYVALILGGLHVLIGLLLIAVARLRPAKPLFQASLNELEKDRQWLQKKSNQ